VIQRARVFDGKSLRDAAETGADVARLCTEELGDPQRLVCGSSETARQRHAMNEVSSARSVRATNLPGSSPVGTPCGDSTALQAISVI